MLKSVNWKENSRIVTFFMENCGRLSIVDRGGRSIKSKRSRLQTFCRMEITYFKSDRSGTGYLTEVDPIESFLFERDGSLGRLTFASAALEILYDLLPEDEPQESLYHMTMQFLKLTDLVHKLSLYPLFLAYLMKLLSQLGYRPNFAGCVGCGKDLQNCKNGDILAFSAERGGLVCSTCQIAGEYYIRLQSDRQKNVYALQTASLAEATQFNIKYKEAENILELLTNFLRYQTGTKKLKSLLFLEKLKKTKF
ncbi:MAG: DNA repair protein RecO [candidate division Zixibacteria bacterium]|nr:DNA repair protein RecO [candidate division Zixibacteria bacterium]